MTKGPPRQRQQGRIPAAEDGDAGVPDAAAGEPAEVLPDEAEPSFRALAETVGAVVFVVQGTRFRYVNSALERITGYSREELGSIDFWETVHPDFQELVRERGMARQQGEDVPDRYEFKALTKNGEERWFDVSSVLVEFEGKPAVVGTAFDVTERKQAEEALREAEAKNSALLRAIPDMMFRVNRDGVYLEFIPGKSVEPVVPPADFIGKRMDEVGLPPEMVEKSAYHVEQALRTGEIQEYDYELTVSDETRHYEARIVACGEDEVLAIVRDVTRRKRAQQALEDSQERYRALYDDNPSMFFTVDTDGVVLSVNRFGAEQLGYTPDALIGESVLKVFHEDDKTAVSAQLALCIEEPEEVADWEFRKVRNDGSTLWVKEAARAVRGPDGDMIVLIVCEDITQRKEAAEALQQAREELESKVESQMQEDNEYGLTFRELTALHLVAEGKSNKEIATLLGISPLTVNKHMENILSKMGASSRTEAGVRAVREELLL